MFIELRGFLKDEFYLQIKEGSWQYDGLIIVLFSYFEISWQQYYSEEEDLIDCNVAWLCE